MREYKEIRFLESTTNLRDIISRNSGRELSLERSNQISVCLEQGRLFFEAAENLAWEIKPLLVYYGIVGFSKAMILAKSLGKLESLPQRHGLKDVSASSKLVETKLKIESEGTFQKLNDTCSELETLIVHTLDQKVIRIKRPTSKAHLLVDKELTLKDILARIPDLERLYDLTFTERAGVVSCSHFSESEDNYLQFEVRDFEPISDLATLERSVRNLRTRFEFLKAWRVVSCSVNSSITFANVSCQQSEFSPDVLSKTSYGFAVNECFDTTSGGMRRYLPGHKVLWPMETIADHSEPIRGNLTRPIETTYLLEPFEGLHLSELSLYYLGMFLLSSLVRYRPTLWANAISRRAIGTQTADDRALVLIDEFVNRALTVIPEAVHVAITQPES